MKLKITILIVLTLMLGFVLGFLTSAQLRHQRMKPVRIYASEDYFRDHFYKVIDPSVEQKKQLDKIIGKHSDQINELNRKFRDDFETLFDNQWKEIKPVLNKDQIKRLEELERNRREAMKEYRKRRKSDRQDHFGHGQGPDRRPPGFERDSIHDRNDSLWSNPRDHRRDSL